MRPPRARRGSALLTAIIMIAVILGIVSAVMLYANNERRRAIVTSRAVLRGSCAESGLQLAKAHFGRSFAGWNAYLGNPSVFDPVPSSFNPSPANPADPALQAAHPELFADLDGDGRVDVYIYVRDNLDEHPPLAPDWTRDNDQNVTVGAVCFSSTLAPRAGAGAASAPLAAEAILSYTFASGGCTQGACGDGTGNMN